MTDELKSMIKIMESIKNFMIVEAQLTKETNMTLKKIGQDIQKIKLLIEEKWQQQ